MSGSTATFTIKVTNTGDVTLTAVHVNDALTASCQKTSAQLGANATLAPGASFTFQCTTGALTTSFTNSATAIGTPPIGPDVTSTDTADVVVIHPSILIEKDPATQTVVAGSTATFTIKVTNTGDATLTGVHVGDALTPDCARTSAQLAGNATLLAGASFTYQCTTAALTQGFTNSATATGTPAAGPDVTSTDTADVVVLHPAIKIEKDPATQTIVSGATATFTIKVTNTGDATLTGVNVADLLTPDCARTSVQLGGERDAAGRCVVHLPVHDGGADAGLHEQRHCDGYAPARAARDLDGHGGRRRDPPVDPRREDAGHADGGDRFDGDVHDQGDEHG